MPGFFVSNGKPIDALHNYDDSRCFSGSFSYNEWQVHWNSLNKFRRDKIFQQNEEYIILLDGIILNRKELEKKYGFDSWEKTVIHLIATGGDFYNELRGGFCGAVYDKRTGRWTVFTDHMNNHPVFIYCDQQHLAIGTQINYFRDWMKENRIPIRINPNWIKDLCAMGYVIDTHSIIQGVDRVFPGSCANISGFQKTEHCYYKINKIEQTRTENEWISAIDECFRKCVERIARKCEEEGYEALVDISGGLDSRMLAMAAAGVADNHLLGINYSESRSLDKSISEKVARTLSIPFLWYQMDGGQCLMNIDDFVFMNQGMNYYMGITGGLTLLSSLDREKYGAEIWGILGDVYEGAMITEETLDELIWDYPRFKTSSFFDKTISVAYDRKYDDNELLWFYLRGVLGGQNTAFIRQNFVECPPAYGDPEYLDLIFQIPYELRTKGHIFRKWMVRKYPELARIPYSGTGVRVTESDAEEWIRRFPVRVRKKVLHFLGIETDVSMNPIEDWYQIRLKKRYDDYFAQNIGDIERFPEVYELVTKLYREGQNAMDKMLAVTMISAVRQFIL